MVAPHSFGIENRHGGNFFGLRSRRPNDQVGRPDSPTDQDRNSPWSIHGSNGDRSSIHMCVRLYQQVSHVCQPINIYYLILIDMIMATQMVIILGRTTLVNLLKSSPKTKFTAPLLQCFISRHGTAEPCDGSQAEVTKNRPLEPIWN